MKNPVFQRDWITRKFAHFAHEFPDGQVFIFLHKRKRLLPKNAALTYTPPNLIGYGETCGPPHAPPGFVDGLMRYQSLKPT